METTQQLKFVKLPTGTLVPMSRNDLELLKSKRIYTYKISRDRLSAMKSYLLKGVSTTTTEWSPIIEKIVEKVLTSLCKDSKQAIWKFDPSTMELKLKWKFSDDFRKKVDSSIAHMDQYLQRYCTKIVQDSWKSLSNEGFSSNSHIYPTSEEGDVIYSVFKISVDEESTDPSIGYGKILETETAKAAVLHLSKYLRIRYFTAPSSISTGGLSLTIVMEDLSGGTWSESIRRTVEVKNMSSTELTDNALFFLSLSGN